MDTQKRELLTAILPHVPFDGWSQTALDRAAEDAGLSQAETLHLCPNGAEDMLEAYMDHLDGAMVSALQELPLAEMKLHEKVQSAILLRLKAAEPHKEAIRKAVAYYGFPLNADKGLQRLYRTVDSIWRAIGDQPTDFSFYTKRLSLAMIYSSTLLYWLDDFSEDQIDTREFLQRRLKDLFTFHKVKSRMTAPFSFVKNKL